MFKQSFSYRFFQSGIARSCIMIVAAVAVSSFCGRAQAVDLTWKGATNLIFDSGNATGNWDPSVPTGLQANSENWIFPDATTLGAGSTTPSFDSGGALIVGGSSGGGLTFQAGAPSYTFTQTDPANTFNLAGTTYTTASTAERGIVTNNSSNKQIFDMDVISSRSTIDAKSGDIEFKAGRTFRTGGPADLSSTSTANSNTLSTIFTGDHNIYLNSNVVQTVLGNAGTNGQRGLLLYRGASTPASPQLAGALILGDLGAYGGRITVDSTNGGVVRATHANSFGIYGGTTQSGTFIGTATTGATANATVELDGTANGGFTTQESFYLGMRTAENTVPQLRNVAGNNTITGFVSLNNPTSGANLNVFNSAYLESVAGKLTIVGSISNDRTLASAGATTTNLYFKGNGDFELGGGVDGGIFNNTPSTYVLNVDKTGTGAVTLVSAVNPVNNWAGTTTIHAGAWIVNGTHTTAAAAPYTIETNGKLGGSGGIGSTVNLSGKIAPGEVNTVGTFTVGGLTPTTGVLDFQLSSANHTAGSTFNDLLVIANDGTLDLTGGATLNVTGIGGNLTAGVYDLIHFGGTTVPVGTAANIGLGTIPLGPGLAASIVIDSDSVNLSVAAGSVAGDYNGDGKVNAADYVLWRKNPGAFGGTPGGYNTWKANFGVGGPGSGSGLASGGSVPEPTCLALIGLLASMAIATRRARLH